MAIITTFPIAAETAGGPAAFEQITLFDVIADLNPWKYMHKMFEPAPLMLTEDPLGSFSDVWELSYEAE